MDTNDQYYMRGGKILKAKMDRIYYILIKEQKASRIDHALGVAAVEAAKTHVAEGSLWQEIPQPSEVDDYRTLHQRVLELHSAEGGDDTAAAGGMLLRCHAQDVQRLEDDIQYQLLRALDEPADRFKVYQDTSWMDEAMSMDIDSVVYVLRMPGLPDRVPAKIRYRGALKNKQGLWFGVELTHDFHGKGNTSGTYLGESHFTCALDSGFFLAVNKLRICHTPSLFHELEPAGGVGVGGAGAVIPEPATMTEQFYSQPNPEELPPNLEVGERVVWISDEGPEHGMVKWIGRLPHSKNKEWTVGVEFDRPIGTGTGKYNNKQLFRAKHNHASLIPLLGLMKEEAFFSTIPPMPPLEEDGSYDPSPRLASTVIYSDPPPPMSPPPLTSAAEVMETGDGGDHEDDDEEDMDIPDFPDITAAAAVNTGFKPRATRSNTSTTKYADTTSSGTTGSHTPNSELDTVTTATTASATGTTGSSTGTAGVGAGAGARSQEEILESLKRPGSVVTTTTSSSRHNSKSRTNTPDSSGGSAASSGAGSRYHTAPPAGSSSRAGRTRVRSPPGPKPPEKKKDPVVEKSIYDTDPDHPYENVERPDDDDDDLDGGPSRFMEQMTRTGQAFAAEGPLYEALDTGKKKKVSSAEMCKEMDYAPLDDYRKQGREDIHMHYNLINPKSPHDDLNGGPPFDPRPPSVPPPAYPASSAPPPAYPASSSAPPPSYPASTPDETAASTPLSQMSPPGYHEVTARASMYRWNDSSTYGSTVQAGDTNSSPLTRHDASTSNNAADHSSSSSYMTSQTHLSSTAHRATLLHRSVDLLDDHLSSHSSSGGRHTDSTSYNSLPHIASTRDRMISIDTAGLTVNKPSMHIDKSTSNSPTSSSQSPRREASTTTAAPPQQHEASGSLWKPEALSPGEIDGELELGSMVEVEGNPADCRYGVIRWIGYLRDKHKPIAGLEMELENKTLRDGTFSGTRLFDCPPNKGFFIYLHKLRRDSRFTESDKYMDRSDSLAFGSLECPDIEELCDVADVDARNVGSFCGKHKGIQGHHNSCYLDATLFSMFAFSMVFDPILFRQKQDDDIAAYNEVQKVLRDGIVNPLRRNFYVRADKVMKLRSLLDQLSSVTGLTSEEKDPEEFLQVLLSQVLRSPPLLQLSSGQDAYLYQLFLEPDSRITATPTTQQLLGLSFLQAGIKLKQVPSCLVLQMPRFGKEYKMYSRIVPSLNLDITGILQDSPRECAICGKVARYECKECLFGDGTNIDQCSLCDDCNMTSHRHPKRKRHRPVELSLSAEYRAYLSSRSDSSSPAAAAAGGAAVHKHMMELFAVVCIETSHYVAFVKSGDAETSPWLFFDSMADRMGEQNGYNVPEVRPVAPYVPDWLREENAGRLAACTEDKLLPEPLKRMLCDGYMAMYRSNTMAMYK